MAASSRRSVSGFNLSFLDIMFCGFGAVVLLVLIISGKVLDSGKQNLQDARLELLQLQTVSRQNTELRNSLDKDLEGRKRRNNEKEVLARSLSDQISRLPVLEQPTDDGAQARGLQEELKKLEAQRLQLEETIAEQRSRKRNTREISGEGNRQYLTGLQLGGRRVLILIDSSASMLDRKIVDIIRLKVRSSEERLQSHKWRRAVATVEWLLAHLPEECSVQLYRFDTSLTRLDPGEPTEWHGVVDSTAINRALETLKKTAPQNGTSLANAFSGLGAVSPTPDNIILITDGLPTQGQKRSSQKTASGEQRIRLFQQAVKLLQPGIPVNTILFPVEGDPMAPVLFWKLALDTDGSFFTPAGDWP